MQTYDGISVVIPHYGDPSHATALARQLREQSTNVPLQVIVTDDCSPIPFPDSTDITDIEIVRRTVNGGFGSAVNSGVEHARFELLLILNSDLTLHTGFIDELVRLAAPFMPALVAPAVETGGRLTGGQHFPRGRFQVVEWISLLGRWRDSLWFRRAIGKVDAPPIGGHRVVDWAAGEAMLLETAAFRSVSGFDESFFMYAEEVDLQRRLHDRHIPTVLVGTTPILHVGAASSDTTRSREWLTTSRLRYAGKWGGAGSLRTGLAAATFVNLSVNLVRRAAGRDVQPLVLAHEELSLLWPRLRGRSQARAR